MDGQEWSCLLCKHLLPQQPGDGCPRCRAFPDGIPFGVLAGEIDHRVPIEGDNGIAFERSRET